MYTLKDINDKFFEFKIKDRGYTYYREKRVKSLRLEKAVVRATVRGSSEYSVAIKFTEDLMPSSMTCNCPYDGHCKHLSALLFHLNSLGFFTTDYYRKEIWTGLGLDAEAKAQELKDKQEAARKSNLRLMTTQEEKQKKKTKAKPAPKTSTVEMATKILERISEEVRRDFETPQAGPEAPQKPRQPSPEERLKQQAEKKLTLFKDRIGYLLTAPRAHRKVEAVNELGLGMSFGYYYVNFQPVCFRRLDGEKAAIVSYPNAPEIISNLSAPPHVIQALLLLSLSPNADSVSIPKDMSEFRKNDSNVSKRLSRVLNLLRGEEIFYEKAYHDKAATALRIQKEDASASVQLDYTDTQSTLQLTIRHSELGDVPFIKLKMLLPEPLWFVYEGSIFCVPNLNLAQYLTFHTTDGVITVRGANHDYFSNTILPRLPDFLNVQSDSVAFRKLECQPIPQIYLEEAEEELRVKLCFAYETHIVPFEKGIVSAVVRDGRSFCTIHRAREFEDTVFSSMKEYGLKRREGEYFVPRVHPCDFLIEKLPLMVQAGIQIFGEENLQKFKARAGKMSLSVSVSSNTDWFEVKADARIGDTIIPLRQLLSRGADGGYVRLDDGTSVKIDEEVLRKLGMHIALAEENGDGLVFSRTQTGAVDALLQAADSAEADKEFHDFAAMLRDFNSIEKHHVPKNLNAKLRPYQKHGFDWLLFLQKYGFGGILADDMGLGKTMQALALFLYEQAKEKKGPSLIVAPTSVIFNWMKEIERFAPSLKTLKHVGTERISDEIAHFPEYDIILTTYGVMLRDILTLQQQQFHYVILDESQKIKNPLTKSSRAARTLKAAHRVCLSGTPVENNLFELWAQFAFVNPGMLGTLHGFRDKFVKQIDSGHGGDVAPFLRKIIYPFILRRTKEVVAKDLPPKTEIIHMCEMSPEQAEFYKSVRDSIRAELMEKIDEKGIEKSGILIIEALLRLRQICNHPLLVKYHFTGASGKFEEFKEMIQRSVDERHKVLVFSQFVSMLQIIKKYLTHEKIRFEYLDGATVNRQACVENFQNDPDIQVFLISLKAGGFGLNLTAADNVFLFDPWWNPAVERQAADRTHRIGQTKPVFIYKFITKDTVEEKILQLQERKRSLVEKIITNEKGLFKSLTRKDIDNLFS